MSLKTHLQVLEESAENYATRPVFQLPVLSPGSTEVKEWRPVLYSQFKSDVDTHARYWAKVLSADGLPPRSVIGVWLAGLGYADVVHIYGVARASYIPQLFSLRLPNPDVIYELLHRANALALIHDPSFAQIVINSPVPVYSAQEVSTDDIDADLTSPLSQMSLDEADTFMIFHTSGSTSGSPKLVRCSLKWVDNIVRKARQVSRPKDPERQDVSTWMGSVCHIGQTFMLIGALQHGSCTIQPSVISFSSDELVAMISKCSLNRLNQFATFLSTHLRNSRGDPKLLALLAGLDEVLYSGLPLGREEEKWAIDNGIKIRNLFGNTECGAMLLSIGGDGDDSRLLRPIEGTSYDFTSIARSSSTAPPSSSQTQVAPPVHTNANANHNMLELVIRSDSGDCPDPSLRHADGHYHTGDLFLEVKPHSYVFRGRDDDWIKSENALRCDTKAIEDNVLATCADLVESCVVVGNGRPSPTLFVEPKAAVVGKEDKLRRDVIRRTRHFHSRRFMHERIVDAKFVVVVPQGTLPRTATKGNIRRKAVEEAFKDVLDKLYGVK
ncbi:acetyl-CoA synthetase-like protein [Cytidiella melzeri]|nr:acetyl-CoA synthetase-like protein [Cytidiella melzeri]